MDGIPASLCVMLMIDSVRETVRRYRMLERGDKIVTGVSGGVDSVALLHILLALRGEFGLDIYAAHVNHCLRGKESDADEEFVRALCGKLNVPLEVCRADVKRSAAKNLTTLEEAGRQCRYAFFNAAVKKFGAGKIAVAHNMDDSAETVLLNITRGTGLKGLCGIPPVRCASGSYANGFCAGDSFAEDDSANDFHAGGAVIVRPLIEQPRKAIELFLSQNNIPYRNDSTNFDNGYARNRVRNIILPALAAELNGNAASNIARGASLLRAEEEYLSQTARAAYEDCVISGGRNEARHDEDERAKVRRNEAERHGAQRGEILRGGISPTNVLRLNICKLSALHPALRGRVTRMAYEAIAGTVKDFSSAHADMVTDIAHGATGRGLELPAGVSVRRDYNELAFFKKNPVEPPPVEPPLFVMLETGKPVYVERLNKTVSVTLDKPETNEINACMKAFRYDRVSVGFTLRTWRPGDRITLKGVGTKKLQDYFTDRKVPRHLRGNIPLLADGGEIVWIMDEAGRVNERYVPKENDRKIYVSLKI